VYNFYRVYLTIILLHLGLQQNKYAADKALYLRYDLPKTYLKLEFIGMLWFIFKVSL